MSLVIVTDAWAPQVNGVVTTLQALQTYLQLMGREVHIIHPEQFETWACPGFPQISLAKRPGKTLAAMLDSTPFTAIHIATEGPLGWAARRYCRQRGWAFSTAFHTKFPETLHATWRVPVGLGYAVVKHFHAASSSVMVPSRSVLEALAIRGFKHIKPWTHGVDVQQFSFAGTAQEHPALAGLPRPYALFAGRVSYEKNIASFLAMPFTGTKFIAGDGPVKSSLQAKYPEVIWLGMLNPTQLAQAYHAADVLAFPSLTDTFGLVMIEAMACGTPVAAYPVDGPLEVLDAGNGLLPLGGVMNTDLAKAVELALLIPRQQARDHALRFDWQEAGRQFLANLVSAKAK